MERPQRSRPRQSLQRAQRKRRAADAAARQAQRRQFLRLRVEGGTHPHVIVLVLLEVALRGTDRRETEFHQLVVKDTSKAVGAVAVRRVGHAARSIRNQAAKCCAKVKR
jgi:hypothetical protein